MRSLLSISLQGCKVSSVYVWGVLFSVWACCSNLVDYLYINCYCYVMVEFLTSPFLVLSGYLYTFGTH